VRTALRVDDACQCLAGETRTTATSSNSTEKRRQDEPTGSAGEQRDENDLHFPSFPFS
jgi:hypothetical protein